MEHTPTITLEVSLSEQGDRKRDYAGSQTVNFTKRYPDDVRWVEVLHDFVKLLSIHYEYDIAEQIQKKFGWDIQTERHFPYSTDNSIAKKAGSIFDDWSEDDEDLTEVWSGVGSEE